MALFQGGLTSLGRRPQRPAWRAALPGTAAREWASQPTPQPTREHSQVGFDLGWEFARYGLSPALPLLHAVSPLQHGWVSGQAALRGRTLVASRFVKAWLQLRLEAWQRGHRVELMHITPHTLAQTEVRHCPLTREALGEAASAARWSRLHLKAACAAGNLLALSDTGWRAHQQMPWDEASLATWADAAAELDAPTARLLSLRGLVQPLAHEVAARLPLRVLPPNRLRLMNPVQALQAYVSRQFTQDGWSQRLSQMERLIPGVENQHRFRYFVMAFMPRVVAAGAQADASQRRWAAEDAWACPRVMRRWSAFALGLNASSCEALVERAHALHGGRGRIERSSAEQATEGWALEHQGALAQVPTGV
jgi:hypothetical protein